MARVKFDDGTVINFEGNPSPDDISDAYEHAKSIRGTAGNIPKTENILQRGMRGAGEVAWGGAKRMFDAGPTSYLSVSGGPHTEWIHGVKTEAMVRGGVPEFIAESISSATDPQSIVGGLIGGVGLAKAGVKGTIKATKWFRKPFLESENIKALKTTNLGNIEKESLRELSEAERIGGLKKVYKRKLYGEEPLRSLSEEEKYLGKVITKASDVEARSLQKELPLLYGKRSQEFGEKLSSLMGDKPINVPAKELFPKLEQSLLKHGILKIDEVGNSVFARAPLEGKELKISNLYKNLREGLVDNPDITINASDLIGSQKAMKVPFGKAFTGEDRLMGTVREQVSSVLEPHVKGLKELRSSFKPYLQAKYQSIKELSPFSTEFETGKASKFVERLSKGNLAPDEKRLVGFLEKEIGREIGKRGKAFGNKLQTIASRKSRVESILNQELNKIDEVTQKIKQEIISKKISSQQTLEKVISDKIKKNNLDKWVRAGIGGIGSTLIGSFLLRKTVHWLGKKPIDY